VSKKSAARLQRSKEDRVRIKKLAERFGVTAADVMAAIEETPDTPSVEQFKEAMRKHGITVETKR
jgi:hypothetical protein